MCLAIYGDTRIRDSALDGARLSRQGISGSQENCADRVAIPCACRICPLDRERKGAWCSVHSCSYPLSPTLYTVLLSPRAFQGQDHKHTHTRISPSRHPGRVSRALRSPRRWLRGLSQPPALHMGVTPRQAAARPTEALAGPRVREKARPRGRTDKAGVQSSPALPTRREGGAALTGPMSGEPEWDFLPESRWPE